jgi:Family of unknown function (DUF6152)
MYRTGLILAACIAAAPVAAHHGWGSYDSNNVLKFQSAILEVKYENPHGEIVVAYQGKNWTITLAPPFRMQNRNLPREKLTVGKVVGIEGYPSRVTPNELRAERITFEGAVYELR